MKKLFILCLSTVLAASLLLAGCREPLETEIPDGSVTPSVSDSAQGVGAEERETPAGEDTAEPSESTAESRKTTASGSQSETSKLTETSQPSVTSKPDEPAASSTSSQPVDTSAPPAPSQPPANVAVSKVSFEQSVITIVIGDTPTLKAAVSPDNATNKALSWDSGNKGVATVSNGVVTAKAAGETTVTVSAGGKTAACKVIVKTLEDYIGGEVIKYADGKTRVMFIWDEKERLTFDNAGYYGTPNLARDGREGIISTLKYHIDKIETAVYNESGQGAVAEYRIISFAITQTQPTIAFVVLYG